MNSVERFAAYVAVNYFGIPLEEALMQQQEPSNNGVITAPDRQLPKLATIEVLCRICRRPAELIPDYRDMPPAARWFWDFRCGWPGTVAAMFSNRICDRCLDEDVHELDRRARAGQVRIWIGGCVKGCGRIGIWRTNARPPLRPCECGGFIEAERFEDLGVDEGAILSGSNHRRVVS